MICPLPPAIDPAIHPDHRRFERQWRGNGEAFSDAGLVRWIQWELAAFAELLLEQAPIMIDPHLCDSVVTAKAINCLLT